MEIGAELAESAVLCPSFFRMTRKVDFGFEAVMVITTKIWRDLRVEFVGDGASRANSAARDHHHQGESETIHQSWNGNDISALKNDGKNCN